MALLVKANHIQVEYMDREILSIPEIEIYDYDRIGIVGRNGVEKSTLMNILSGTMEIAGCKRQAFGTIAHIKQLAGITAAEVDQISDRALLGKMNVSKLQTKTASGGEITKIKIAAALSEEVHGIFADEPTCNLDGEGVDFLVGQLRYFDGALVLISHDRYFMDCLVNKTWEISDCTVTEYFGNYSDYLLQKQEERNNQAMKYNQFLDEKNGWSKR